MTNHFTPTYTREPSVSNEVAQLQRRNGRPYSEGHRRMYKTAIELLRGQMLPPLTILEAGTGIGYGLEQMLQAGLVGHYVGIEPNADSYRYVAEKSREWVKQSPGPEPSLVFSLNGLLETPDQLLPLADYSFCIEVIEHVAAACVVPFLTKLREHTRYNLFLSTPDASRSRHGVATADQWRRSLDAAGWNAVIVSRQWTDFYLCEPVRPREPVGELNKAKES